MRYNKINNPNKPVENNISKYKEKIIFNGLKQLEENIIKEIAKLYSTNIQREYSYEIGHPPNKVRIIKCLLEYVNIEKLLHSKKINYLRPKFKS
jgi:hypothetical protein